MKQLIIVLLLLLSVGCTKSDYDEDFTLDNTDLVIIQVDDLQKYTYTDLSEIGDYNEYRKNGDLYSYHTSGNMLHVSTERNIDRIELLINHGSNKDIEFSNNEFTIDTSGKDFIRFRVYYD